MDKKRVQRSGEMIQWVGVLITLVGLAYTGLKDYQKGDIKFPQMPQKPALTKVVYPVQYCLMAYDPNVDKVFYLHENGIWHDYAPQQRRYEATPQRGQAQGQEAVGSSYGTQRASGYSYGQQAQASTHTQRY
jgi:hypothetical protein